VFAVVQFEYLTRNVGGAPMYGRLPSAIAVLTLDQDTAQVHVGNEQFLERLQAYLGLASALHARVPDIEYVDLRFADRVYVRPALAGHHVTARPDAADRR
jgi:hypothetical protein